MMAPVTIRACLPGLMLAGAGVVSFAGAAQACALEQVYCEIPGGRAELVGHADGTVVFREDIFDDVDAAQIVLVDCPSGIALSAHDFPGNTDAAFTETMRLFDRAVRSAEAETFAQLSRSVRQLGVQVDRGTLAAGHCGCTLPDIVVPGCPPIQ